MDFIDDRSYRNTTLAAEAQARAASMPEATAIYFDDGSGLCYGEAWREGQALAAALRKAGLEPGATLSFQLPNSREAVILAIAASIAGLVINPIVPIYRGRELSFILADAGTRVLFIPSVYRNFDFVAMIDDLRAKLPALSTVVVVGAGDRELPEGFSAFEGFAASAGAERAEPVAVDPDSVKIVLYTSGTTGNPKAVRHSHNTLEKALQNGVAGWSLGAGDLMLMPSPVTHVTGYVNGIELPFFCATRSLLMSAWDVNRAIELIESRGATVCVSATPFLRELVDRADALGKSLPGFRLFACGGASVPPSLIYDADRVLADCRAVRVYGSTEAPLVTVGFPAAGDLELAAETDGRINNYEVIVCGDDGRVLGVDAEGEILVRGPAMMLGYADESQNAAAFSPAGFFHTGDIGKLLPSGAICITDRKKDIIIRGGENLSAREIEEAIESLEAVAEVAVVAVPHERLGEGVAAVIVPRAGAAAPTLEAVLAHLGELGLARQKWPQHLECRDALPKTPSGKVQKEILRKALREAGVQL